MLSKNMVFACDAEYEDAETVIFGAPFDSTTSNQREPELRQPGDPQRIFRAGDLQSLSGEIPGGHRCFDSGDLELCFGSSEQALAV